MDLDEKILKTLDLLKNSSNIIEDDTVYNKLHTYLVQFLFQEEVSHEKMEKIGLLELFRWSYNRRSLKNPSLLSSTLKCMADLMKREQLLQIVNLYHVFNIIPKFKCSCDSGEHLAFKEVESVVVDALLSISFSLATHKSGSRYLLQHRISQRFLLPSLVHKSRMVNKKAHDVLALLLWNSDDEETFSSILEEIKNFRACDYDEYNTKNEDYQELMRKFYRSFIPLFKFGDRSKMEMISWSLKEISSQKHSYLVEKSNYNDFNQYKVHLCLLSISCSDSTETEKQLLVDIMENVVNRKLPTLSFQWTVLCDLVTKCQNSMASHSSFLSQIQKYSLHILMIPLITLYRTLNGSSEIDISISNEERYLELERLISSHIKADESLSILRTYALKNQRALDVAVASIEASNATWMVHTHLLPMLNTSSTELGIEHLLVRTLSKVLKNCPESAKTNDSEVVVSYLSTLANKSEFSEPVASLECLSHFTTQNDLSPSSVASLKNTLEIYMCKCNFDINDATIDCLKSLVPVKQSILATILSDSDVVKASCISFLCTSPFLQENSANFIHTVLKSLPKDTFSPQELESIHSWCILCVTTDSEDSPHVIAEALNLLSTFHTNFTNICDKSCYALCHRNCFRHITSDVDVLRYAALKYIEMHIKQVGEDKVKTLCEDGSAWCVLLALKDPAEYISEFATTLRQHFVTDKAFELHENGVMNGNTNHHCGEKSSKRKLEETADDEVMDVEAVLDEVLNDPDNESLKKRLRPSGEPAKQSHSPSVTVVHYNDIVNYKTPSQPSQKEVSRSNLLCLLEDIDLCLADKEESITKDCY